MSGIEFEVKNLISIFYKSFEPEMERYKYLELVKTDPISEKDFYTGFFNVYSEIRTDTAKKVRYFISKKILKLNNECTNKLPEIDNIHNLSNNIKEMYWETLYQSYMLFESIHPEKNEAVINTLAVELKKVYDNREQEEKKISEERIKSELINSKKMKKMNKQIDSMDISSTTNKLIEQASSMVTPEIASLLKSNLPGSLNIMDTVKESLSQYPRYSSIISSVLESYLTTGEISAESFTSIVNTSLEGIDTESEEFNLLTERIYKDMLYIYEKPSSKSLKLVTRINNTFEKYKSLLEKKSFSYEEIMGCVWKIANDTEKRAYIDNMEKDDINSSTIKLLIKKHIPPEFLAYIPMDINTIIDTVFTGDMSNISSLLDIAKGWLTSNTKTVKEEEKLTEDQMAELEKFYDKILNEESNN